MQQLEEESGMLPSTLKFSSGYTYTDSNSLERQSSV